MSKPLLLLMAVAMAGLCGCAGPENKLGRGLMNVTEFARLGELRRSIEQTALWDGSEHAYTTGIIRGVNRSLVRTGVGVYEIVTFPIPSYEPVFAPESEVYPDESVRYLKPKWGGYVQPVDAVYPASYKPALAASPTFDTDTSLGFSGGDVFPRAPGSRFRIFDH